jgi:hypothetical protein
VGYHEVGYVLVIHIVLYLPTPHCSGTAIVKAAVILETFTTKVIDFLLSLRPLCRACSDR